MKLHTLIEWYGAFLLFEISIGGIEVSICERAVKKDNVRSKIDRVLSVVEGSFHVRMNSLVDTWCNKHRSLRSQASLL